jgi:hypothetical protein
MLCRSQSTAATEHAARATAIARGVPLHDQQDLPHQHRPGELREGADGEQRPRLAEQIAHEV